MSKRCTIRRKLCLWEITRVFYCWNTPSSTRLSCRILVWAVDLSITIVERTWKILHVLSQTSAKQQFYYRRTKVRFQYLGTSILGRLHPRFQVECFERLSSNKKQ